MPTHPLKIKSLLYTASLLLILPNFIFYLTTWWLGDTRALINIDYLLPFLCLISCKRPVKIIGVILFSLIFFIDLLIIVFQHFPALHLKDTFYLLSFIFTGPKTFLIYAIALLILLTVEISLSWQLIKKTTITNILVVITLLIMANLIYYFIEQAKGVNSTPYNTPLANSSTVFFIQNQQSNFANLIGDDKLIPSPYYHATTPWTEAITEHKPLNQKLFLIIVESWGAPLNQAIQDDILKNLTAQTNQFDYFKQGNFAFRGFTVEGELRELCQLYPSTLDLYQIKTGFQNCLPHKLNTLGYETQAIHGGGGTIYGRKEWWPNAGFKIRTFQEDLNKPINCIAFNGICDWDVIPYIKQSFTQHKKLFNYWLTLTSHYSYYTHDIHNKRFNCATYNLPENGDACHNFMLQAQLFDHIATLVSTPEMRGVEVIIVGDHPPPLMKASEIALFKTKQMQDGKVGWVHFKIKDNTTNN